MKSKIYSLDGVVEEEIELPECFSELIRPDLIKRAVLSDESRLYQPKGAFPRAGLQTSAVYNGRKDDFGSLKNIGQAKLPREVGAKGQHGKVKRIPSAVKGRRAHPPKTQKILIEQMNKKEYKKALRSAIAATMNTRSEKTLPIIFNNSFEEIKKTNQVLSVFEKFGIAKDIEKAKIKTKALSGTRRVRSKSKYTPKSILVIVKEGAVLKAARNLAGVDAIRVSELKVRHLAPGTHAGRFTVFSENAIEELRKML
ncbi:MAG: 50S ribosomal protein L4 [Candidatus Micrarchaeota archaeon]